MLQTPNAFLHARNERKTVEMDLQLMANRLARLQAEEAKAVKKVEAMRRKAGEIVEQKQRNLQKYQMKYQHVSAEFEALQQQAAQQAYLRQQHRENLKVRRPSPPPLLRRLRSQRAHESLPAHRDTVYVTKQQLKFHLL
jgi:chromosome segregation ATPase